MDKYEELCLLVEQLRADLEKLHAKGNKSAGTRARALVQDIKRKGQEIRDEIQEAKRAIGKKRK
jgi:recombinational DNA repair protein RecR